MRNRSSGRMTRASAAAAFVGVALALLPATAAVGGGTPSLVPEKVIGGPSDTFAPTSNGTWIAWSQWDHATEQTFVRRLDSTTERRLNERGTGGSMGGFVGSSNTLIYQQFHGYRSDLYFYDVQTRDRTKLPAVINTSDWEYWPLASNAYILFARLHLRADHRTAWRRLFLFDRMSESLRPLTKQLRPSTTLSPDVIGETSAGWTVCAAACNVWIWDAVTDTIEKLPNPQGMDQYGAAIDEAAGTITYSRDRSGRCGRNGTLRLMQIGSGTSTTLTTIPDGLSLGIRRTMVENPDTGNLDLYVSRYRCDAKPTPSGRSPADILVYRDIDLP